MQQQMADIRRFLKTVIGGYAHKVFGERFNFNTLVGVYIRHIGGAYGEDNIVFVQHFIVLQVVQQRAGYRIRIADHKHGIARHALRRVFGKVLQEGHQFQPAVRLLMVQDFAAFAPSRKDEYQQHRNQQWQPAAGRNLQEVGRKEGDVEGEEGEGEQADQG